MQNAFDRQKRNRRRGERGPVVGSGPAAPRQDSLLAPPDGTAEPEPEPAPALDVSARKALVKQAAGKSTRQVQELLAGVDPELALPADKVRPLGNGRYEMKVVIDAECHRALEQLRGLLSHVDPHMTLGQLVGRLAREGLDRHDPAPAPSAHRQPVRERGRNFGGEEGSGLGRHGCRHRGEACAGASQWQHHFGAEDEAQPGRSSPFGGTSERAADTCRHFGTEAERTGRAGHPGSGETARMEPRRRAL